MRTLDFKIRLDECCTNHKKAFEEAVDIAKATNRMQEIYIGNKEFIKVYPKSNIEDLLNLWKAVCVIIKQDEEIKNLNIIIGKYQDGTILSD